MTGTRFKAYPEYKISGIEWLGEIPADWEAKRLKSIASISLSNVDKKAEEGQEPVLLCNYVDVYKNEYITPDMGFMSATATSEQIRRFALRAGDVLITKDSESWDDIAVPACIVEDMPNVLCGYHLALLRPSGSDFDGRYVARSISAIGLRDQFWVAANGITRYGLTGDSISIALLPVPELDEQRAIADFLDRETAKIDALVEKKERLIELLQEKRIALITHAVTKGLPAAAAAQAGLDPNVPMKDSGIEWLGQIPAHWEVIPLKWRARCSSGNAIQIDDVAPSPEEYSQIRVIGGNGLMGYTSKANVVTPVLAIGRVGALCGNVHRVGPPAWVTDNALILQVDTQTFAYSYLHAMLLSRNLNDLAAKTAQPLITGTQVRDQRLPCPPMSEQRAIVDFLDRETAKIDALIAKIQEAINRLKEYRIALISAAVTGKIDVRNE